MTARILEVSPHEYHRLPGFSASLAKLLVSSCALKAKDAYERRQEQIAAEDESDDEKPSDEKQAQLDRGTVLHALVLGRGAERIEIIPTDKLAKNGSYGTDAAKALRDGARKAGRIPVKEPKMPGHLAAADAVRARLAAAGHPLEGRSELAIEWSESTPHGPITVRSMLDHVELFEAGGVLVPCTPDARPATAIISDLKIVADANPDRCERSAEGFGYAIQACAYKRALNALYPSLAGRISFRFLFVEPKRPYLLWDPERLSGPFHEIGERRWVRAAHAWGRGLATGEWPDYRTPDRVEITAPLWTLKQEGITPEEF